MRTRRPIKRNSVSSLAGRMKVYFRFDRGSVPEALKNQILDSNSLTNLDGELYAFEFDPAKFVHAWQLLGKSPTRFGNDLSQYLGGARDFFDRTAQNGLLSLTFGNSDFKKRASEDLAASIASLFMVDSFGIKWKSISQIPENRNLSKTRPDFEGFTSLGERYIYESKGRSSVNNVISAINKAVPQVKDYPESALQKLAFVTYISSDERAFPSHTFLLDPQMPDTVPPDESTSKQLHMIHVLDFAGFTESKKAYLTLLKARFAKAASESRGVSSYSHENRISKATESFNSSFKTESEAATEIEYKNHLFLSRVLPVPTEHGKFKFTAGIQTGIEKQITGSKIDEIIEKDLLVHDDHQITSFFTDGTLFRVEID